MREFLIGLATLTITGLTFVAYNHRTVYQRVYKTILNISLASCACISLWNLAISQTSNKVQVAIVNYNISDIETKLKMSKDIGVLVSSQSIDTFYLIVLISISAGLLIIEYVMSLIDAEKQNNKVDK